MSARQTELAIESVDLPLRQPFRTARGVRTVAGNVLVRINSEGTVGLGETAAVERFGESRVLVFDQLQTFCATVQDPADTPATLRDRFEAWVPNARAARSAIDMAVWDWTGKRRGLALYRLFGVDLARPLSTSFTLGIDEPKTVAERALEAAEYRTLKLKVGGTNDQAIVEAVRRVTDRALRVDANEGWDCKESALEKIEWLADRGVELVEQPLPAKRLDDVAWLRQRSPLPLVADEDCIEADDVTGLAGAYDMVNLKLDKNGGLTTCRRMIAGARRAGLGVMIGCTTGSSLAIAAAAHLAQLADLVDLDSHLFLTGDPFEGLLTRDGQLHLSDRAGLGVASRAPAGRSR